MFHILIAEDDRNTRKLMSATSDKTDYEVLTACDRHRSATIIGHIADRPYDSGYHDAAHGRLRAQLKRSEKVETWRRF